ncbi:MAG: hypothetical protein LBV38_00665 [Alistipes sp.]|jgi:hypothetical protein|nr:hypothetical protein [Alistipes sp.]
MKKFLIQALSLAAITTMTSCIGDRVDPIAPRSGETRLQLTIERPNGGMISSVTRAIVDPEEGEKNIASLHLLFFERTSDGSGAFIHDYTVPTEYLTAAHVEGLPFDLKIGSGPGANLSHLDNYSILACANIAPPALSSSTTESEAREMIAETTYTDKFTQGGVLCLPMSGTTTKEPNQELVTLKLTRMVARFDLRSLMDGYEVTSVSIRNAAKKSRIWEAVNPNDLGIAGQIYAPEAYSVTPNITTSNPRGDIYGGLYSFENFVGDPQAERNSTTALVIGLSKDGAPAQYYRVDVYPEGEGQNLKGNHVYLVTLRGVTGPGEATPEDAAANTDNPLDVTINNWPFDDDGLILNDGTNMLVAPSRIVRFGPEAETREFVIYTSGTGTLEIVRRALPNGFTATVTGNTLTVSVTELPADPSGYQEERSGEIDLGFVGLRGTITIIQTPRDDNFLNLDRATLPIWGTTNTAINEVTVAASGAWTAKIYNTSESTTNPGFEFDDGTQQAAGAPDDKFRVRPTGSNPSNSIRQGFVVVTLSADSKYRQVLVMMQDALGRIEISPIYPATPGLTFDAAGFAKLVGGGDTQKFYRMEVRPGKGSDGTLNAWEASLEGTHAAFFNLTAVKDPVAPYVVLSAKGQLGGTPGSDGFNYGATLNDVRLKIGLEGVTVEGESLVVLPVVQDPMVFKVNRVSRLTRVPVKGIYEHVNARFPGIPGISDLINGYVEYEVELPDALTWSAEIISQSHPNSATDDWRRHEGFLLNDSDEEVQTLSDQPAHSLRVGFHKIYYPMVHWASTTGGATTPTTSPDYNIPTVEIRVSITGLEATFNQTITVEQEPLTAKSVDILNSTWGTTTPQATYGGIGENGTSRFGAYMRYYSDMILSTGSTEANNFGTGAGSTVRTPSAVGQGSLSFAYVHPWPAGVDVANSRNHLNMGGHDAGTHVWSLGAYQAVERWRTSSESEGFVFFIVDQNQWTGSTYYGASSMGRLGWQAVQQDTNSGNVASGSSNKRAMKYLKNGPFGQISNTSFTFYDDGYSVPLTKGSLASTPNAVSLLESSNYVMLAIDPENRIAYLNDCQAFGTEGDWTTGGTDKRIFLRNFAAIMVNSAMYGSHFYDLLREDCNRPLYTILSNGNRVLIVN